MSTCDSFAVTIRNEAGWVLEKEGQSEPTG